VTTGVTLDGAASELAPVRRRWMLALGSVAMSAGLLAACLLVVDARQVSARLAGADLRWLYAFFGVYVLQLLLLGVRWSLISEQLGVPLGWRRACSEYALSILINVLLPTGFAGDGWRALRHSGRSPGQRLSKILETLALDRLSGQVALLLGVLASVPFAIRAGLVSPLEGGLALALLLALSWAASRWARQTSHGSGLGASVRRFARRAASVLLHPRGAAHLSLSLLLVGTQLVQLWLAARAAGIVLDVTLMLWLGPLISLSASVPSFFGSWGIREGASALLFASAGLTSSAGVAVSLLVGTFSLLSALPGAIVLLADGQAVPRGERGSGARGLAALRGSLGGRSVRRFESASTNETSGVDSAST
jgi:uncharacterized membrane protein YbhN (UPF0104 family)